VLIYLFGIFSNLAVEGGPRGQGFKARPTLFIGTHFLCYSNNDVERLLAMTRRFSQAGTLPPDPPSRHHLPAGAGSKEPRCLRSFLPAAYYSYASVVAPRSLASNTLLVHRGTGQNAIVRTNDVPIRWWILVTPGSEEDVCLTHFYFFLGIPGFTISSGFTIFSKSSSER
jgi:hypothetical protein